MISLQPRASRSRSILVALLGVASCSNELPSMSNPPRAVGVPDAAQSTNAAGASGAGTSAPPIVDAGAPDSRTDKEAAPEMDATTPNHDAEDVEDDAGMWTPPPLECVDDTWLLAPGFLLARPVDYVADRVAMFDERTGAPMRPRLLSEAGSACATAKDRAVCMSALELAPPITLRHLVTTAGDTVRVWDPSTAATLFGRFDTPAEVLWWAQVTGPYVARCNVVVTPAQDGEHFSITNLLNPGICGTPPPRDLGPEYTTTLEVNARGEMIQAQVAMTWWDPACSMEKPQP